MTATSTVCPTCGASASGRFCSACGSSLSGGAAAATACPSCRQPLPAGARFCRHCGASTGGAATARGADRLPWLIAGGSAIALLGVLIAFLAKKEQAAPAAQVAQATSAAPTEGMPSAADLAAMTPKDRFDRLYNRVMRAAESGDMATVEQFSPMAKMAYTQLDTVSADSRYHMAMLDLHTGAVPEAKAVADTLLLKDPGHLFGFMLQGSIARFSKDDQALAAARKGFLDHYDAEMKKGRPEYGEHQRAVDDFKAAAQGKS